MLRVEVFPFIKLIKQIGTLSDKELNAGAIYFCAEEP